MKKENKLLAECIKRVHIAGVGSLFFDKEFVVKRNEDKFSSTDIDNVRYTIYKLTAGKEFDYAILGKCLLTKSKSFLIAEETEKQVKDWCRVALLRSQKDFEDNNFESASEKEIMDFFIKATKTKSFKFSNRAAFVDFINEYYGVKL